MNGLVSFFPAGPAGVSWRQQEPGVLERLGQLFHEQYCWSVEVIDDTRRMTSSTAAVQYMSRLGVCISKIASPLTDLSALARPLGLVDNFIDGGKIVDDAQYFFFSKALKYDLRHGVWTWICLRSCFTVADCVGTLRFADYLNIINTADLAKQLAGVVVFGCALFTPVTLVALPTIALTAAALGYVCMLTDCAIRLHQGEDSKLTCILTARSIIELIYKSFLLSGGAAACGVVATGVIGGAAASLAVWSVYEAIKGPGRPAMYCEHKRHWIHRLIWT